MMRNAAFLALLALGFGAYAQEGDFVRPRVRVAGEGTLSKELILSERFLVSLDLTHPDLKAVKEELVRVNKARKGLFKQLGEARGKLQEAQKGVEGIVDQINEQEVKLHDFIHQRVPDQRKADYKLRARLLPVMEWLGLSQEQVKSLVAKQRDLLTSVEGELGKNPRQKFAESIRAAAASRAASKKEREDRIKLLEQYDKFNKNWLKNIEGVLETDEQKKLWRTRYRRTLHPEEP